MITRNSLVVNPAQLPLFARRETFMLLNSDLTAENNIIADVQSTLRLAGRKRGDRTSVLHYAGKGGKAELYRESISMFHTTTIILTSVEYRAKRPGFNDLFHKVRFSLYSEGIPITTVEVWVHEAYPLSELDKVAKTFLWQRLSDMSEAARSEAFSEEEIRALWEQVKPDEIR